MTGALPPGCDGRPGVSAGTVVHVTVSAAWHAVLATVDRRLPGPCRWRRRAVVTGTAAAALSGLPSTLHALVTGRDPLAATRAAGTLPPGRGGRPGVVAGIVVHVVVSAGWTAVLATAGRRRRLGLVGGCAAGLLIAAFDLEVAGRRRPAIRALPRLPQWLDHVAFGAVGVLLAGPQARHPGEPQAHHPGGPQARHPGEP